MHADKERGGRLEIMEIPRPSFGRTRGRPRNDMKPLCVIPSPPEPFDFAQGRLRRGGRGIPGAIKSNAR